MCLAKVILPVFYLKNYRKKEVDQLVMDFIEEAENGDEEEDDNSVQEISDESDFEPVNLNNLFLCKRKLCS